MANQSRLLFHCAGCLNFSTQSLGRDSLIKSIRFIGGVLGQRRGFRWSLRWLDMLTDRTPVIGLVHQATPTTLVPLSKIVSVADIAAIRLADALRSTLIIVNFFRSDCPSQTAIICRSA